MDFASIYDFSIEFWTCSKNVVSFGFLLLKFYDRSAEILWQACCIMSRQIIFCLW